MDADRVSIQCVGSGGHRDFHPWTGRMREAYKSIREQPPDILQKMRPAQSRNAQQLFRSEPDTLDVLGHDPHVEFAPPADHLFGERPLRATCSVKPRRNDNKTCTPCSHWISTLAKEGGDEEAPRSGFGSHTTPAPEAANSLLNQSSRLLRMATERRHQTIRPLPELRFPRHDLSCQMQTADRCSARRQPERADQLHTQGGGRRLHTHEDGPSRPRRSAHREAVMGAKRP
jgi:hypothetical protein